MAAVAALAALAGCGKDAVTATAPTATTAATTTTAPARTFTAETTSNDGIRFKVTLTLGGQGDCLPAGGAAQTLSLSVTNTTDRQAPFPPLRIERMASPGGAPQPVNVRDPSGACTFTPRVSSVGPGQSVTFPGSTPPGGGQVQVSISETNFTLVAPLS